MHHRIWLVMRNADGCERPFPLRKARTVIGSSLRADVRIAIPSVADKHCLVRLTDDELRLIDLGSENGTLHNGARVEEVLLEHADEVTVGPVTFEVRFAEERESEAPEAPEVKTTPRARGPRPRLQPIYRTIL